MVPSELGRPLWFVPKCADLQNFKNPYVQYASAYLPQSTSPLQALQGQGNLGFYPLLEDYVRQGNLYSSRRHRKGWWRLRDFRSFGLVYYSSDKSFCDRDAHFLLFELGAQACFEPIPCEAFPQIARHFGFVEGRAEALQRRLESISERLKQNHGRVVGLCRRVEESFGEDAFETLENHAIEEFVRSL